MAQIFIGTSGWQYNHWKENFYPEWLPVKDWLRFYSLKFNTVEINSTFYQQPKLQTVEKWQNTVPQKFVFSVKGNRFITQIKRLKNLEDSLRIFFDSLKPLKKDKTVVLWQFSPNYKQNLGVLENFLKILLKDFRFAFEFRHDSWVDQKTYDLLKKYNIAVVFQDWPAWPQIREITADFVYIRFHGNKALYSSSYSKEELIEWAEQINAWLNRGLDVYTYFNNDAQGYAILNAQKLKELVTS